MRFLVAAASFAAMVAAPETARADSPVAVVLAPGEVLLEIDAQGTVTRPAERARLLLVLSGHGATPAEARSAVEGQVRRAIDAARQAGVPASNIRPVRGLSRMGFIGNESPDEYEDLAAAMTERRTPAGRVAQRPIEIVVNDPAAATRVRSALEGAGIENVGEPVYELVDGEAAHRAARAEALRRARADAEAYAAAANMRVVRVVRIGARLGPEAVGWTVYAAMMQGQQPSAASETDVEIQERVAVDYALAPR